MASYKVVPQVFCWENGTVVTGGEDQTTRLWDAETGRSLGAPIQQVSGISGLAYSTDARQILTGSHTNTARLWDAATWAPASPAMQHSGRLNAVHFVMDNR